MLVTSPNITNPTMRNVRVAAAGAPARQGRDRARCATAAPAALPLLSGVTCHEFQHTPYRRCARFGVAVHSLMTWMHAARTIMEIHLSRLCDGTQYTFVTCDVLSPMPKRAARQCNQVTVIVNLAANIRYNSIAGI